MISKNGNPYTNVSFQMMEPSDNSMCYGSSSKKKPCQPCFQRFGTTIHHRHHSSRWFQTQERAMGKELLACKVCKKTHGFDAEDKGRIILFSSSTLHNTIFDPSVRAPCHIDIETICGGRLTDMYRTWRACYIADENPMHVILVTGLNDVMRVPPEGFETVLQAWYHELFDLHPASTIRMCKLMRTPSQCWFPANGPLPVPGYVNYLDKVNQINVVIDNFNKRVGHGSVLGFGCEGCRGKKGGILRGTQHKLSDWREASRGAEFCLHLKEKKRVKMMIKLFRYVEHTMLEELL